MEVCWWETESTFAAHRAPKLGLRKQGWLWWESRVNRQQEFNNTGTYRPCWGFGIYLNISGRPAHTTRGIFLNSGLLPLLFEGTPSDYTLRTNSKFLTIWSSFFVIRHYPIFSYVSFDLPLCILYSSQIYMSYAANTIPPSVLFTPFPLHEMSSHLFLPLCLWQMPSPILWPNSKVIISKKPFKPLPNL